MSRSRRSLTLLVGAALCATLLQLSPAAAEEGAAPASAPSTGETPDPAPDPSTEPDPGTTEPVPPDPAPVTAAPTALTLTAMTNPALRGSTSTLTARLTTTTDGVTTDVAGQTVELLRKTGSTYVSVATQVTGSTGVVTFAEKVSLTDASTGYRAVFAGTDQLLASSTDLTLATIKNPIVISSSLPSKVTDEKSVYFTYTVKLASGAPVRGAQVRLYYRKKGMPTFSRSTTTSVRTTDSKGVVKIKKTPREDITWRVTVASGTYYDGATSASKLVDNVPIIKALKLPGPAPSVKLAAQPRATTRLADVRISSVPDKVWSNMQGKSWRKGCTARSNLRYMTVNYWAFDGYRRRGELVVAASVASRYKVAFERLYSNRVQIRSLYRVDKFGYSRTLGGGDDYKSMRADNTSAFNCRGVVGNPSVRSPHASGRSLDINPWENPYHSRTGWTPNTYWVGKQYGKVAWNSHDDLMVRVLKSAGFRWTYGNIDGHHFDL